MSTGRQIVIYHYINNSAVYLEGELVAALNDGHPINTQLAVALGLAVEYREVRYQDLPGWKNDNKPYRPPAKLADMEKHFKLVEHHKKLKHLQDLRREINRLEQELREEDEPCVVIQSKTG